MITHFIFFSEKNYCFAAEVSIASSQWYLNSYRRVNTPSIVVALLFFQNRWVAAVLTMLSESKSIRPIGL